MKYKTTPLSTTKAAEILNLSEQRVRTLCKEGGLDAQKIGKTWIIEKKSVSEYGLKSGHVVAEDHVAYVTKKPSAPKKPVALSFFSGAMGMDLGIKSAGFDVRLACEFDKFCRQTITINKPDAALLGDINDCTAHKVRKAAGLSKSDDIDLEETFF